MWEMIAQIWMRRQIATLLAGTKSGLVRLGSQLSAISSQPEGQSAPYFLLFWLSAES
jgi:hypothetical protein